MKEIEVGEYGRTNYGKIIKFAWLQHSNGKKDKSKVILINEDRLSIVFYYFTKGEKIVKHSKQLKDLIECGDIVEDEYGKYEVAFVKENKIYCNDYNYDDSLVVLKEKDIKTILTKESYKANCYKVGGEDE